MATAYSQKVRQRKFIYWGVIALAIFLMLAHRRGVLELAAVENSMTETNLGDVDLGGSITRFALASLRGPLTCGMWWDALEKQARHEYNDMELVIRGLTKLQPHFKGPWKYQAWNLAYNVSVEFDRVQDKYSYIAQGIQWLVNGERMNRARIYDLDHGRTVEVGDPDMRWEIGFYTQDKMTVSDENLVFRCFLPLGCIKPETWNPTELRNDPQKLEQFKAAYPQLIRHIRDHRYVSDGADEQLNREIIAFFERYQGLPSIYPDKSTGKARLAFPLWPEPHAYRPANEEREEDQHPYEIARQWYAFSLEPLPPAIDDWSQDVWYTPTKLTRTNKGQHSLIFRSNPPRAKCLQGRDLAMSGWAEQSQVAWRDAYDLWLAFGLKNGIEISKEMTEALKAKALVYAQGYPDYAAEQRPPPPSAPAEAKEGYHALTHLSRVVNQRNFPRYDHWKTVAEFSRTNENKQARAAWYLGQRRSSDLSLALASFDKSLSHWYRLLTFDPNFGIHLSCSLTPGVPATLAYMPWDVRALKEAPKTIYAYDIQLQEELVGLHDEYMRVLSRQEAPRMLAQLYVLSELQTSMPLMLGASPATQLTTAACAPVASKRLLTIDRAEDWFLDDVYGPSGPFDAFISADVRSTRATRERPGSNRGERLGPVSPAQVPQGIEAGGHHGHQHSGPHDH